jgi:hypothetical protein
MNRLECSKGKYWNVAKVTYETGAFFHLCILSLSHTNAHTHTHTPPTDCLDASNYALIFYPVAGILALVITVIFFFGKARRKAHEKYLVLLSVYLTLVDYLAHVLFAVTHGPPARQEGRRAVWTCERVWTHKISCE